jgi:hypothetical protein
MSEAIILTPGIDCAHEWHPIELEDTTCGYVDGDWLICDKCRSMVKKAEKVDTFAEEVLRLRDALKLVHRDAEYREIAIADLRADVASKQARITELEGMIERFWGTDAVKRAGRAEKALQEMETRADYFEAKVVDAEAERDLYRAHFQVERAEVDRLRGVLTVIGHPKQHPQRDGVMAIMENMRLAALASLDGVPNDKNDPLAALRGEK